MQQRPIYFADSSALIGAWVERYPLSLFPSVWDLFDRINDRFIVCDPVRTEIARHTTDLVPWLDQSNVRSNFPLSSLAVLDQETVQRTYSRIVNQWPIWSTRRRNRDADPWVIALASGLGGTVVSEEKPNRSADGTKTKIPDVCEALGVGHKNLLQLFERENL